MKYKQFPMEKPNENQILYVIGNTGTEQLAEFKGGTRFDFYATERKGYYARLWRPLTDVEQKSFDATLPQVKVKRKYTKRKVKTKK